jgi:hypothetical protein
MLSGPVEVCCNNRTQVRLDPACTSSAAMLQFRRLLRREQMLVRPE